MTHAMVFTGFGTNGEGTPVKLRVENSWGESRGGDKGELEIQLSENMLIKNLLIGYLVMTVDWFREYGYEAVVDKKYLSEDIMKVFDMKPIVLPAWDPMGSLARI